MEKDNNIIYVKCDCSGEMLEIEKIKDDFEDCFYVSIWKLGIEGKKLSFINRLKWIKNILFTGMPWNDFMIINNNDAVKLNEFLSKHLKLNNNDKVINNNNNN